MMAKKQKLAYNLTAYKHFHSTSTSKRRNGKNRKKYFEHDTRTQTIRSIVNPISAPPSTAAIASTPAPIKKIKFNNEINIYETTLNAGGNLDTKSKGTNNRKKFRNRRISNLKIQTTTTKLQKQLIETQKKLQKQLFALQTHQHRQNHSFLAFIRSNCIKMPINDDLNKNKIHNDFDDNDDDDCGGEGIGHDNALGPFNSISKHLDCSDIICKHFQTLDQTKCQANDKITAKWNNTTAIRPKIACDSKNCVTSTDQKLTDFCHCIGADISSAPSIDKRMKFRLKRPLLKSIVLNKEPQLPVNPINIKPEPFDYPNLNKVSDECLADKTNMQFDKKHNKQINSYIKVNDLDNGRSYSPPLPKSSRITSSVSNNTNHMASTRTEAKEVRTSRDRKSSKKKKRRRRSYSKGSRSRSRSRSYSRRSRRASSSSRSRSPSRSSKHRDRRSSKRDDCACNCRCSNSCRKSSKKERHSSKRSNSKINSKSPSNERDQSINFNSINPANAFNSKPNNLSTQCDDNKKNMKKILGSSVDAKSNGAAASKKKLINLNTGILLKQQPIVKLQSSPGSGSDSDNEIDDRFDKKYEELLTFETHEDERREQRLLKALSDIAAKAKQKIQSITDTSMAKINPDKNHNDRTVPKATKIVKKENARPLHESPRDDRNADRKDTEDEDDDDDSPRNKKQASRRSRHESTSSSSKDDERSPRSSRSPSIPRRRGSPSFLDRRRITSARKKPIPYQRSSPYDSYDEWDSP